MATILITGATGSIGTHLIPKLRSHGHAVKILSTKESLTDPEAGIYHWNPDIGSIDKSALLGTDIIIHLAGANLARQRWDKEFRAEIRKSRIETAALLLKTCKNYQISIRQFISASGIGYYPEKSTEILTENSEKGTSFLSDVCKDWEQAARDFEQIGAGVAILRTGPVLSAGEGMLKTLTSALPWPVIPTTGRRRNKISWVHLEDLCEMYVHVVEYGLTGIFNATAPYPCTQIEMAKGIAKSLNKFCFFPNVPGIFLKIALGKMASIAVSDQHVSCEKMIQTGFTFRYTHIAAALNAVFHKK